MLRVDKRFFGVIASTLALAAFSVHAADKTEKPGPTPVAVELLEAPTPFSGLNYIDKDGKATALNASQHALTIVHFWATWCTPCIAELPEVDALHQELTPKGVQVLAIALDGAKPQKILDFYAKHGIRHLPFAADKDNGALTVAKVKQLPATLFLNRDGKLIARADGVVDWESAQTKAVVEKLVEK